MIQIKTGPDRADAGGRPGRRPHPRGAAAAVRPGSRPRELDAIAEASIRGGGRRSRRSSATSRKSSRRSRRRSAPRSTTRSCTASPARGCCRRRRHLDRLRRDRRRLARRRGDHRAGRRGDRRGCPADRVTEESLWRGIAAAPARRPADRHRPRRRGYVRGQGDYGIVEEYGGHGIGTEMHQDPHVLNYGRPGPRAAAGAGPGAGGRADGHPRQPGHPRAGRRLDRRHRRRRLGRPLRAHLRLTDDGPWVLTALDGGGRAAGRARA